MLYYFICISVWLKYLKIKKKKETREAVEQWKIDNAVFYSEKLTSLLELNFWLPVWNRMCDTLQSSHYWEEGSIPVSKDGIYPTLNSIRIPNIPCGKRGNGWALKFVFYLRRNWSQMIYIIIEWTSGSKEKKLLFFHLKAIVDVVHLSGIFPSCHILR